jgi:glycosyltransferase involved in cell wall biosynthesis
MIYYDITDLLDHFRHCLRVGGVARVSTATIARFQDIAQKGDYCLIAYHPVLKKTVVTDSAFPTGALSGPAFSAFFGLHYRGPHPLDAYLARRYRGRFSRAFHKLRLSASNALTGGKTFRRKGVGVFAGADKNLGRAVWRAPEFVKGDVAFISGGTRSFGRFQSFMEAARRDRGLRIVQFLHDILPITDPEFFLQGHPMLFADWLTRVNAASDLIIATTRRTAEDYKTAITQRGEKAAPVHVVALAHEFLEDAPEAGTFTPLYEQISTPVLKAARLPYVLCVGTREIRKNNLGLARVWERLRQKHDLKLPRLIFAGRQGWMNDEFDRFLLRTGNANDSIVMVESPSDVELAYLYRKCLFSVFPSFCEGWGLPVGESLWYGRPVLTSNCSAMPEVAGDYADYADPYDLETLMAAVERMLDPAYREARVEAIAGMKKRDWQNFSDDLWRELRSA